MRTFEEHYKRQVRSVDGEWLFATDEKNVGIAKNG